MSRSWKLLLLLLVATSCSKQLPESQNDKYKVKGSNCECAVTKKFHNHVDLVCESKKGKIFTLNDIHIDRIEAVK